MLQVNGSSRLTGTPGKGQETEKGSGEHAKCQITRQLKGGGGRWAWHLVRVLRPRRFFSFCSALSLVPESREINRRRRLSVRLISAKKSEAPQSPQSMSARMELLVRRRGFSWWFHLLLCLLVCVSSLGRIFLGVSDESPLLALWGYFDAFACSRRQWGLRWLGGGYLAL